MVKRLVVLATAVACLLVSGCAASSAPEPVPNSPTPLHFTSRAIENEVKSAFGADLGSVTVTQEGSADSTYSALFTLRGVGLEFPFSVTPHEQALMGSGNYGRRLLHDRTFVHNDSIGGNKRFVSLARRYATDFPTETHMSYWPACEDGTWPVAGENGSRFINKKIGMRPGPSVIVLDFNDYWVDASAQVLGIYSWNAVRQDWDLVHKGDIPRD